MATALEQLDISRFPSVALIDTQPVVSKEDSKAIPGASSPEALPFIFGNLQVSFVCALGSFFPQPSGKGAVSLGCSVVLRTCIA